MQRLVVMCLAAMLAAHVAPATCRAAEKTEVAIPLDQVPEAVKAAAVAAVKGLVLEKAEKETKNGVVTYDVEGTANGKKMEVKVSAEGKVIEIEDADDDDDDNDDDDKPAAKAVTPPAPPKGDF